MEGMPDSFPRLASARNERLKAVRRLRAGKDRDHLLLEGLHLVEEALARDVALRWVLAAEERVDALLPTLRRAEAAGAEVVLAPLALLVEVGDLDSPASLLGWAERPAPAPWSDLLGGPGPVVVAAGVQEPGNVGALARVAAGLGARGLVALKGGASPWHPRALRGASGTTLGLAVRERVTADALFSAAREAGAEVWGADAGLDAVDARAATPPREAPFLLLLGEEGRGLDPLLRADADQVVQVPLHRGVESLNVATAAAVLVWELHARRAEAGAGSTAPATGAAGPGGGSAEDAS